MELFLNHWEGCGEEKEVLKYRLSLFNQGMKVMNWLIIKALQFSTTK